jgi:hypothetical protein
MEQAPIPPEIDTSVPSASRMYDYYLGGSHHFPADRQAADRVLQLAPFTRDMAVSNRAFLRRVVTFLVREAGVRQFVDLGSGVPTVGNVHEVAHGIAPETRVVYVDVDPVAVAHSRLILEGNENTRVVQENALLPGAVLRHPAARAILDFDQPVAVLMISILPFITDAQQPAELVAAYVEALSPGSYLAISHASLDGLPADLRTTVAEAAETYTRAGQPVSLRGVTEIGGWFDGLSLVDPGLVPLPQWRPDSADRGGYTMLSYGGVGRVP